MKYLVFPFVFISLFCISGCDDITCARDCRRLGYSVSAYVYYYGESASHKHYDCYCETSSHHMQEVESLYDERLIILPAENTD